MNPYKNKTVSNEKGLPAKETVSVSYQYNTSKRMHFQDLPANKHGYVRQVLVSMFEGVMGNYILQSIAVPSITHRGGNHE